MAKYEPLRDHLASCTGDTVSMTFPQVEELVGSLPPTARSTQQWWANDSKVQAKAWRAAGWHVDSAALTDERVVFARGEISGAKARQIAAGEHSVVSRQSVLRAAADEKFCPLCFVAVPASGVCDSCSA